MKYRVRPEDNFEWAVEKKAKWWHFWTPIEYYGEYDVYYPRTYMTLTEAKQAMMRHMEEEFFNTRREDNMKKRLREHMSQEKEYFES